MKKLLLLLPFAVSFILPNPAFPQIHQFQGNWTKLGTTYDFSFDLYIRHTGGNSVEGVFNWQAVHWDENDPASKTYYEEKIGLRAKEFVRGTYDPSTHTYRLQGYKKEDPHLIIGIDTYMLEVDDNGDIGGKTKAFSSWKGRINGKAIRGDSV